MDLFLHLYFPLHGLPESIWSNCRPQFTKSRPSFAFTGISLISYCVFWSRVSQYTSLARENPKLVDWDLFTLLHGATRELIDFYYGWWTYPLCTVFYALRKHMRFCIESLPCLYIASIGSLPILVKSQLYSTWISTTESRVFSLQILTLKIEQRRKSFAYCSTPRITLSRYLPLFTWDLNALIVSPAASDCLSNIRLTPIGTPPNSLNWSLQNWSITVYRTILSS